MTWTFSVYSIAFIIAGGLAVGFAVVAWLRRPSPGARPFAFLMLATAEWVTARALEGAANPDWAKVFWAKWEYLGIVSVPVLFLLFSLEYSRVMVRWRTYYTAFLFVIPITTVILAFTNEWHGLIWASIDVSVNSPYNNLVYTHGVWFWLAAANNYAVILAGIIILTRALFRHRDVFRRQTVSLLAGVAVPLLGNGIYLAGLSPVEGLDLTPFCFTVTGFIYLVTIFRLGLFRIVPLARNRVVEAMADGVIVLDNAGRVLDINPAARHICSFAGSGIGRHIREIWPDCPNHITKAEGDSVTTVTITDHTHSTRTLEIRSQLLTEHSGNVAGLLVLVRDVTEREKAEAELKRLYEREQSLRQELEDEVNRRTEYTRSLVHELNTPLTAMIATSELLIEEVSRGEAGQLARILRKGTVALNKRIEELLDVCLAERGLLEIHMQPVDLRSILQHVTEAMAPLALKKAQALIIDIPESLPEVWGNENRLRWVLINLVGNAIKYTGSGGNIHIRACVKPGEQILVEVQDNGRGVPPEELPYVFDPYHRKPGDRARLGGLSLGLPLSKMLIELHRGKIWINSEPGRGTTVGFSIPAAADG